MCRRAQRQAYGSNAIVRPRVLAFALMLACASAARGQDIEYYATPLGALPGTTSSDAYGINNSGEVVGESYVNRQGSDEIAFIYENGQMVAVGPSDSIAFGINDSGVIAGVVGGSAAVGTTTLMSLGFPGSANAINNSGQIAAADNTGNNHAALYSGGQLTLTGELPGGAASNAYAINNQGTVAGWSYSSSGPVPIIYNGTLAALPTLSGSVSSEANAINDNGQVAGQAQMNNGNLGAFLYTNGAVTDLGTLGGNNTTALGINNSGQVVGSSNNRAFVYSNGAMSDLNSHLDPASSTGWTLQVANAINNKGQIVGQGTLNGKTEAFLLTPMGQTIEPTLTGAIVFNSDSSGSEIGSAGTPGGSGGIYWSTRGLPAWSLYVTSPNTGANGSLLTSGNGSSQVSVPLAPGMYQFNILGDGGNQNLWPNFGMNLFFDGSTSPSISVVAPINSTSSSSYPAFYADLSANTRRLDISPGVPGAATLNATIDGQTVALTNFYWSAPSVNSLDRVSPSSSVPNGVTDFVGGFTLVVAPQIATRQVTRTPSPTLLSVVTTTLPQVVPLQSNVVQFNNPNTNEQGLLVYTEGSFSTLGSINRNEPTIVLTHGWNSSEQMWTNPSETNDFAAIFSKAGISYNVVAWNWSEDADTLLDLGKATSRTLNEGSALAQSLISLLGPSYSQDIHFYGHSLGTLVNAEAVNVFNANEGDQAKTQVTLFDDAEVGNLSAIPSGNSVSWAPSLPQAGEYAFADNYISIYGGIRSGASNTVLTDYGSGIINPHFYPISWYSSTVGLNFLPMGDSLAVENSPPAQSPPPAGTVYLQNPESPSTLLLQTDDTLVQSILATRVQPLLLTPVSFLAASTQGVAGAITGDVQYVGHVSVDTIELAGQLLPRFTLIEHSPSYMWVPISIPSNAIGMSFDFVFQDLDPNDYLTVGINETQLFALEDAFVVSGATNNSGLIDVSQWSGQDVELFLGLNSTGLAPGGTMTIDNIDFYETPEPSSIVSLLPVCAAIMFRTRRRRHNLQRKS